ncbi:hypothetical protein ACTGYR_11375, partial [Streptococcus suis]
HATGAYGAAMASSYNSRPISPQVMVDGDRFELVGDRTLPFDTPARLGCKPRTAGSVFDAELTQAA